MEKFKEYCKVNKIKPTNLEFCIYYTAINKNYKFIGLENNKIVWNI